MSDKTEDDLLDEVAELSPLSALDPEEVDKLTPLQRRFLVTFINNGSISMSRKLCGISTGAWDKWKKDEKFQEIFQIVKNPPAFAGAVRNALIWASMLRLFQMVNSDKERTAQWAIEMITGRFMPKEAVEPSEKQQQGLLSQRDVKLLAESLNEQLSDEAKSKVLRKQPFQIVEGEVRVIPAEETHAEVQ